MGKKSTREKLMDAAEILFAERGFATTSVRDITKKAGVNLAALNYHFGSKLGLVEEIFRRKIEPINARRLEMLRQFEAEAGDNPVPLEKLLEAFLVPPLKISREDGPGRRFVHLMGRIHMEAGSLGTGREEITEVKNRIMLHFTEVFQVFRTFLFKSVPELDPEELLWRLSFTVGAMAHSMMMVHGGQVNPISDALASIDNSARLSVDNEDKVIRYLIQYVSAGFEARPAALVNGEVE